MQPSFSPDRHTIAFARGTNRARHIWTIGTHGQHLRQVTFGNNTDNSPTWEPDAFAPLIAFTSNRGHVPSLWKVQPNGRGLQALTDGSSCIGRAAWSPRGYAILLDQAPLTNNGCAIAQSRLAVLDSSGIHPITTPAKPASNHDFDFSYTPDGRRIIYAPTTGDLFGRGPLPGRYLQQHTNGGPPTPLQLPPHHSTAFLIRYRPAQTGAPGPTVSCSS